MYGPPGRAYVYLVYGMYDCLNVVTEPEGRPAAVLIRAVEPLDGLEAMRAARWRHAADRRRSPEALEAARRQLAGAPSERLASGPGLVAAAFDITRADTGTDLLDPAARLHLEPGPDPEPPVEVTARVGIDYAPEPWRSRPWRFLDPTSPAVSTRGSRRRTSPS